MNTTQSDPPVADQSAGQAPELDRLGRRRHAGQFKPGQSGNPSGKRKEPEITTGSTNGLPLDDRMVLILAEEWTDAELRRMARKDPATYQKLLALASKVRDKGAGAPSAVAPPPPDEPTERVVALAEQLLKDLAAKHGSSTG